MPAEIEKANLSQLFRKLVENFQWTPPQIAEIPILDLCEIVCAEEGSGAKPGMVPFTPAMQRDFFNRNRKKAELDL